MGMRREGRSHMTSWHLAWASFTLLALALHGIFWTSRTLNGIDISHLLVEVEAIQLTYLRSATGPCAADHIVKHNNKPQEHRQTRTCSESSSRRRALIAFKRAWWSTALQTLDANPTLKHHIKNIKKMATKASNAVATRWPSYVGTKCTKHDAHASSEYFCARAAVSVLLMIPVCNG